MTATNMCSNFGGFRCSPRQLKLMMMLVVVESALADVDAGSC